MYTATTEETIIYKMLLPKAKRMMKKIAKRKLSIKDINNAFLVSPILKNVLVTRTMVNNSKVYGSEAWELMNFLKSNFPSFDVKIIEN